MSIQWLEVSIHNKQTFCLFGLMLIGVFALAADHTPPGRMLEVEGRQKMHLRCSGQGSPAVILDAGLGGSISDWALLQPLVARYTTVCSYDRAGNGWSEKSPRPRSSVHIADELHTLLHRSTVPSPYVLVGHSFGGFNMRVFAATHPNEAAGLVLIDASHEEQFERYEVQFGISLAPKGRSLLYLSPPRVPQAIPAVERAVAMRRASTTTNMHTVRDELLALRKSARDVRRAGSLPNIPLVVISRGRHQWQDRSRSAQLEGLWMELQVSLTQLAADRQQIVADQAGHYVHLDQPKLVNGAIEHVVRRIRGASPHHVATTVDIVRRKHQRTDASPLVWFDDVY